MVAQGDRRGYQHLLDEFWAEAEDQDIPLPSSEPVSAAAFCKARRGLKPDLLRELLYRVGNHTDQSLGRTQGRWQGRRVFAIDGTTVTMRRSPELWNHFGAAEGSHYPQASVSILSDVLTGVTYDVSIGPYGSNERTMMMQLLDRLNPGDVLVLDRGYPSYDLIDALSRLGIDFVIRMPRDESWPMLDQLMASAARDLQFVMPLRDTSEGGEHLGPVVRAVKCERPGEDPMLLVTSLSRESASLDQLDELYHLRWAVEETYKLRKGLYLNQRQMHSMNVEGVEQEILALHLFISLARTMRRLAGAKTGVDHRDLSQKAAILATGRFLAGLALAPLFRPAAWMRLIKRTLLWIARRLDRRRPDRSYQRRSFQPRPRWSATGRVGKVG